MRTLRTLNYGNNGICILVGNAGYIYIYIYIYHQPYVSGAQGFRKYPVHKCVGYFGPLGQEKNRLGLIHDTAQVRTLHLERA